MYEKKIEKLSQKEISFACLDPEQNKVIVETAGFVPLEVKFKRFEQNGLIAQFNDSEFTSSDLRDIYLTPDFQISPEDDYEEAFEKLQAQKNFIDELKNKYKTSDISGGNSEVAPQADSTKGKKEEKQEVNSNSDKQES